MKVATFENTHSLDARNEGDQYYPSLSQKDISLTAGKRYKLMYTLSTTNPRDFQAILQHDGSTDNDWTTYYNADKVSIDDTNEHSYSDTFSVDTDKVVKMQFNFGKFDRDVEATELTLKNVALIEI